MGIYRIILILLTIGLIVVGVMANEKESSSESALVVLMFLLYLIYLVLTWFVGSTT